MDKDKPGQCSDLDDELPNEADRSDADVLAELDAHVQDLDDVAEAAERPLAQVINIADRRMGRQQ